MPDFLPNRQRNQTPYQVNTTPGVPQSPFNSYNPTGGGGGGWQPGQANPTMAGQVGTPATQTAFGTSPALDQNAVWQGYAGVRNAAASPSTPSPGAGSTWNPISGQWIQGIPDPWAGNQAGQAAFDQQRNAAMNAGGAFGTAPALDQNAVWNQYAGVRAGTSNVPTPPGGPTPQGTSSIGQGMAPRTAAPQLGQVQGAMNPMQQMQQQLAQYGITPDMWQQLMQMFGQQQGQQQPQTPDMSWQGGN